MLTLKNVKVHSALSEETLCMSCDVYWQGRLLARAANRGTGGMTDLHVVGSQEDLKAAKAFAAEKPFLDEDGTQMVLQGRPSFYTLDELVDALVDEHELRKRIKRQLTTYLKTKTVYIKGLDLMVSSSAYSEKIHKAVLALHPEAVILNALPMDEAIDKYVEMSDRKVAAERVKKKEAGHAG